MRESDISDNLHITFRVGRIILSVNKKNGSLKSLAQGCILDRRTVAIERRDQSFWSVIYGGLYPRRVYNRRPVDDQKFIIDWHDNGLFMVAMAIILMSLMDALFTLNLLSLGAEEINYFMKVLIEYGASLFLTVKLSATSCGVVLLVAFARFKLGGLLRVRRVLEILCGVYGCLIVWELYLLVAVAADAFA